LRLVDKSDLVLVLQYSIENRSIPAVTANNYNEMNQSKLEVKHGSSAKRGKTRVSFDWL